MNIIDYDEIETWAPWISRTVAVIAPPDLLIQLRELRFQYIEDAQEFLLNGIGLDQLVTRLNVALNSHCVRVYHGTRLTDLELDSVKRTGLRALIVAERRDAITAVFEQHLRWHEVQHRMDETMRRHGPDAPEDQREDGSVHVCFS